ncbi:hypothetical protein [uncultured Umboniibacter sp.]|uniref:hypothetical protein n=1 Tax=uncultured Umboniibacter sp. TaxID=1798917 RepID=UPI0026338395|nr:hypothetical protein [uncultured Umboniibacter sp.]
MSFNDEADEMGFDGCPKCHSNNVQGGSFDVSDNTVSQKMLCDDCEAEWYDVYQLVTQEIVE